MEDQLDKKEREVISWRQESGSDLSDRVSKQKFSKLRIALMKIEDAANQYADEFHLLKLR